MPTSSALSFAVWLSRDQPDLFKALLRKAVPAGQGLGDWSDFFSDIGSGVGSAVTGVANFIASPGGSSAINTIANTVVQSQAQKNALQVQMAQLNRNQMAAPIQTVYNPTTGQYEATLYSAAGPMPLTSSLTQRLSSTGVMQYLPYIVIGGGFLLLLLFMRR